MGNCIPRKELTTPTLSLARHSAETTNKQCEQEDASTYGSLAWTCQKHLAASDFYKLSSLGSVAQHYNGSRATYMHDRQQYVRIASEMSVMRTQVPQRSVLGPALFDVYINNLPSVPGYCSLELESYVLFYHKKKTFQTSLIIFLKVH